MVGREHARVARTWLGIGLGLDLGLGLGLGQFLTLALTLTLSLAPWFISTSAASLVPSPPAAWLGLGVRIVRVSYIYDWG